MKRHDLPNEVERLMQQGQAAHRADQRRRVRAALASATFRRICAGTLSAT